MTNPITKIDRVDTRRLAKHLPPRLALVVAAETAINLTDKGYKHLAELAAKRKPVVISDEDWERYYMPRKGKKHVPIDGEPGAPSPIGKPAYYMCSAKGSSREVCVWLPVDSDYQARHLAAVDLQCEPGHVVVRGPFVTSPMYGPKLP